MNRLRLAAFILTAGITFIGGCTASYTVGNGGGGGGLFGGRLFNRNGGLCGSGPECCPAPVSATPCCETGIVSGFEGPGPILMPQDSMNMFPHTPGVQPGLMPGAIPPGAVPGAIPAPAGSSTKLIPVPYATTVPYKTTGH